METKYCYELEFKVRDYECDMQGIVNNANYQHYLEHARHEFLQQTGTNFNEIRLKGIEPVVSRSIIKTRCIAKIILFVNYMLEKKESNLFSIKIYTENAIINFV